MDIVFKTKFCSHLYGTSTPKSDTDYKGIYQATLSDIVHQRDKATIHQDTKTSATAKNSKEDVDVEWIELRKFLSDCIKGQTYALDMLFAPGEMWAARPDARWEYILDNRDKLLTRDVKPFIGYCRQQAGKYGLKGSRLGELIRVIKILQKYDREQKLSEVDIEESEFVYKTIKEHKHSDRTLSEQFLVVIGKHYSMTTHVGLVLDSLERMDNEFGNRAREAQANEGVDWKAISHAYRCCYELMELASTGKITFPLAQAPYLTTIKRGEVPYTVVQTELAILMRNAESAVEMSTLPEEPDREFWEKFIEDTYIPTNKFLGEGVHA